MKAAALTIALVVALTAPALAAKKSKRAAKPANTVSDAQKTNDASYRLVRDSLPIWLPTWSLPIYLKMKVDQEQQATVKTKKAKRKVARR